MAILLPTSNNCNTINRNISVYTNDTVKAQHLKSCQTTPRLYSVTTPNHIDVFAVDCKDIVRESAVIEGEDCGDGSSSLKVFLDESACSYSNYLLQGSELEVTIDEAQLNGGILLVCVYTNIEAFKAFKNLTDTDHLATITASAQKCDVFTEVNETEIFTYTAPEDAYYYGGIKTPSSKDINSVQYTFEATRYYYNPEDYVKDKINCFSDAAMECSFNKTGSDTCVLFHATTSSNGGVPAGVNVVRMTAQYNFQDWRFILTMTACALLLSIVLSLTCMSLIYILV